MDFNAWRRLMLAPKGLSIDNILVLEAYSFIAAVSAAAICCCKKQIKTKEGAGASTGLLVFDPEVSSFVLFCCIKPVKGARGNILRPHSPANKSRQKRRRGFFLRLAWLLFFSEFGEFCCVKPVGGSSGIYITAANRSLLGEVTGGGEDGIVVIASRSCIVVVVIIISATVDFDLLRARRSSRSFFACSLIVSCFIRFKIRKESHCNG